MARIDAPSAALHWTGEQAAALERAAAKWWETLTDEQRAAALDGRPGTLANARPVTREVRQHER